MSFFLHIMYLNFVTLYERSQGKEYFYKRNRNSSLLGRYWVNQDQREDFDFRSFLYVDET